MLRIERDLGRHICKDCDNLTYWDWYFCKLGHHKTKKDFLNMRPLKKCDSFIERNKFNYPKCNSKDCVFWCDECKIYKERGEE